MFFSDTRFNIPSFFLKLHCTLVERKFTVALRIFRLARETLRTIHLLSVFVGIFGSAARLEAGAQPLVPCPSSAKRACIRSILHLHTSSLKNPLKRRTLSLLQTRGKQEDSSSIVDTLVNPKRKKKNKEVKKENRRTRHRPTTSQIHSRISHTYTLLSLSLSLSFPFFTPPPPLPFPPSHSSSGNQLQTTRAATYDDAQCPSSMAL